MANILIVGANGLIGKDLSSYLQSQGHSIRWLVRHTSERVSYPQFIWDPQHRKVDQQAFRSIDILINFSGSPIASGRWTAKRKSEILHSRLESIQVLSEALAHSANLPQQIIQASAIGYYGDCPEIQVTEQDPAGTHGFLCDVTRQWEAQSHLFKNQTQILTIVRTGLYLHPKGGVWPKLIMTLPFRVLNYFGDGKHLYSWIHHMDYNRAIEHLIHHPISGPVNLTAAHPVSHKEMVKAIRKTVPCIVFPFPPKRVLKILLGKMSSLLLDSCEALPKVLLDSGFQFNHPHIEDAVHSLINKSDEH